MSKYLINKVQTYRMDSEDEAKAFVEKMKKEDPGDVIKYSIDHRERKQKGEIIDEWVRTTITTHYNDEREPDIPYIESENKE